MDGNDFNIIYISINYYLYIIFNISGRLDVINNVKLFNLKFIDNRAA